MDTVKVTDADNREIEVRKLSTLDRMRLLELVGPENALNDRYLGYATLAYSVVSIDGKSIPVPNKKVGLEATVKLLDENGFNAVATAVSQNFLPAAQTSDEANAAVKNG